MCGLGKPRKIPSLEGHKELSLMGRSLLHQKEEWWSGVGVEGISMQSHPCHFSMTQGKQCPLANKCGRLSSGVSKYNRERPLQSQCYPARHHPLWFSKGFGNSGSGTVLQGFTGLFIHSVPGTAPGFPSLPPVYKLIKYPQGCQSPEARGDSKKVIIHTASQTLWRIVGLWKDRNDILPSPTSLTLKQGN